MGWRGEKREDVRVTFNLDSIITTFKRVGTLKSYIWTLWGKIFLPFCWGRGGRCGSDVCRGGLGEIKNDLLRCYISYTLHEFMYM